MIAAFGGGGIAGVHRRGIAAFGGRESRRLAAEKTPYPRRGDCRGLPAEMPVFTGGNKRGIRHRMVSYPPLDSPSSSFALTHRRCAAKRGLRGLGSVRRADFGTLLCPEFTLRSSPRITVRGQTVQGVRLVLRKAPLRSSVDPWSTKRHCGPLAFRRATEGSRVLRRVWGSQEGAREPYGALAPFCPCRWAPTIPPPPGGGIFPPPWARHFPPVNTGISAARRRHFPKPRGRFKQRTNSPSIFQLSMFAIDIFYFPWYS